jgi:hypothetical protein
MNLAVDKEVPVVPGSQVMVLKTGDNLVRVKGTWVRSGRSAGSALANPLQTSQIDCVREQRICTEARAEVGKNVLFTDSAQYEIRSWTRDSIVMVNELPCALELFTIDLNTESVSGAGRLTNMAEPYCSHLADREEQEWKYKLVNGFSVYWEQRQKARPFALRLIHTAFGNYPVPAAAASSSFFTSRSNSST